MDSPLPALRNSVDRLHQLCRGLDDAQLETQSYSREWSIADVLSHLGSGAVVMRRRLEDRLDGAETPDDFAPAVWDEWNAKSARAKADDALVADEGVLEVLESVSPADRARLSFPMGPLSLGFDEFAALRLNEHAFHTWDIEVVFDDDAHLPHDAVAVVVDNLGLIARYTGRPTGEVRDVAVRTARPGEGLRRQVVGRQRGAQHRRGRAGARRGAAGRGLLPAGLRQARPVTTRRQSPATRRCSTPCAPSSPAPRLGIRPGRPGPARPGPDWTVAARGHDGRDPGGRPASPACPGAEPVARGARWARGGS